MNFYFMEQAVMLAKEALKEKQWPVGAVVVHNNKIIACAKNEMETRNDPSAHAEILAAKEASRILNKKFLSDCQMYVTLQPCLMCMHTLQAFRIGSIIFGAYNNFTHQPLPQIIEGVLEKECSDLLIRFSDELRKNK